MSRPSNYLGAVVWQTFRNWRDAISFTDPLQQRQASLFQNILLFLLSISIVGLILMLISAPSATAALIGLAAYSTLIVGVIIAITVLRRGSISIAIYIICGLLIAIIATSLLAVGLYQGESTILSFTIPIVLCGLVVGRKGLFTVTLLCLASIGIVAVLESIGSPWAGIAQVGDMHPLGIFGSAATSLVAIGFLLDRFGTSLREAFASSKTREQELEALRFSLEQTVAERTASLQLELEHGERREQELAATLKELQTNQALVRDLSAPVLPVLPGVLVAPLIGSIDDQRASLFGQHILSQIEQQSTRYVIMDITGVPLVDTQVAQTLLRIASAVRLLGAEAFLVGVRPEVAQTLVALGARLDDIPTFADLREAVAVLARGNVTR
jgi:rsbT co-antagonist protein RsbR